MSQRTRRNPIFQTRNPRRLSEDLPPADGRPHHHLPNGLFRNPPGSPARNVDVPTMLRFFGRMTRQGRLPVDIPDGHVMPEHEALAMLRGMGAADSLTWLGHAAFLIRVAGRNIITDPYLTDYAGPGRWGPKRYVKSGISIENLPPIDLLLISHNHYDHLDEETLIRLPNKERIQVVAPLRLGQFFLKRGFQRVVELDWDEQFIDDAVAITALPVVHWSRRNARDTNRTLWAGFSIRSPGMHLFFGGDSAYGKVFGRIGESYGPFDAAMIGIGAYAPREIMQASHATPEEAVQIGKDIGARNIVGMHWGTVGLTEEPPFEPPERFRVAGRDQGFADENLWVMRIGETRPLEPLKSGN